MMNTGCKGCIYHDTSDMFCYHFKEFISFMVEDCEFYATLNTEE